MKGQIDKEGDLLIERAGKLKHQYCYPGGCEDYCSDNCPKFREPEKAPSGEIQLGICDTILYFSELEDLRGSHD